MSETVRINEDSTYKILVRLKAWLSLRKSEDLSFDDAIQYLIKNADLPDKVLNNDFSSESHKEVIKEK